MRAGRLHRVMRSAQMRNRRCEPFGRRGDLQSGRPCRIPDEPDGNARRLLETQHGGNTGRMERRRAVEVDVDPDVVDDAQRGFPVAIRSTGLHRRQCSRLRERCRLTELIRRSHLWHRPPVA